MEHLLHLGLCNNGLLLCHHRHLANCLQRRLQMKVEYMHWLVATGIISTTLTCNRAHISPRGKTIDSMVKKRCAGEFAPTAIRNPHAGQKVIEKICDTVSEKSGTVIVARKRIRRFNLVHANIRRTSTRQLRWTRKRRELELSEGTGIKLGHNVERIAATTKCLVGYLGCAHRGFALQYFASSRDSNNKHFSVDVLKLSWWSLSSPIVSSVTWPVRNLLDCNQHARWNPNDWSRNNGSRDGQHSPVAFELLKDSQREVFKVHQLEDLAGPSVRSRSLLKKLTVPLVLRAMI